MSADSPSTGWEDVYDEVHVSTSYEPEAMEEQFDDSQYVVEHFLNNLTPVHAPKGYNRSQDDLRFKRSYNTF